jgi:hypothetical protein
MDVDELLSQPLYQDGIFNVMLQTVRVVVQEAEEGGRSDGAAAEAMVLQAAAAAAAAGEEEEGEFNQGYEGRGACSAAAGCVMLMMLTPSPPASSPLHPLTTHHGSNHPVMPYTYA